MRQNWPERLVAGPARPEPGQCRARRRRRGRRARDRHRHARRRRAVVGARHASRPRRPGAGSLRLPRDERPEIILSSPYVRARQTAELDLRAGRARRRPGADDRRRAAARARVRHLRPADDARHPRALPGGSRAPPPARQVLSPAAGRRELGRRDPAPAVDAQHDQPPLLRQPRAGRLPPGRGAVLPLHPRGARRGRRSSTIDKQAEVLNCGIAAYEFEPDAKGCASPTLELWNHGAPLEAEGAPKTSAPDAMAGTR